MSKIVAVIPAYNEEKTIAKVLTVVKKVKEIKEIIVVDDGSKDKTAEIARKAEVIVLSLPKRVGKGGAVKKAVPLTGAGILLFLDADFIGLKSRHIKKVLEPVISGQAAMSMADIGRNGISGKLHTLVESLMLCGFRALKRSVFEKIPDEELKNFCLETALNHYCRKNKLLIVKTIFPGIKHRVKESKRGIIKGLVSRFRMVIDIISLETKYTWQRTAKKLV